MILVLLITFVKKLASRRAGSPWHTQGATRGLKQTIAATTSHATRHARLENSEKKEESMGRLPGSLKAKLRTHDCGTLRTIGIGQSLKIHAGTNAGKHTRHFV